MRVVKVLSDPSPTFESAIAPWDCLEVVRTADAVPKGEKFIKYRDGDWFVYRKSKVHLAIPRYVGRYDNVLSAVHSCRLV